MENKDNKTYIKTMKINLTLMSPFENEEDIKKYNNDDLKMLIKSLQCHRCCLLDKLHEEQKKIGAQKINRPAVGIFTSETNTY